MIKVSRALSAFALIGLLATTACSTNPTQHTATFNVSEFASDAQAIAYAATIITNLDVVKDHIGTEDRAHINTILADIKSITSQATANSGGTITIDTGKTWVKSLAGELQNLLTITAPIVKQYDATAASYMTTVSEMIPLINALIGGVSVTENEAAVSESVEPAPIVRSKIYAGFTPSVSLSQGEILRSQIYNNAVSVKK